MVLAWRPQRTLTLVLILVALAPWIVVFVRVQTAKPVTSSVLPSAIVWNDRVFTSEHGLAAWLRSRGASYSTWEAQHPRLARILAHGAPFNPPKPAARTAHRAAPTRTAKPHAPAPTTVERRPATPSRTPPPATRGADVDVASFARGAALFAAKGLMVLLVLALLVFSLGPDRTIARLRPSLAGTGGLVEVRVAAFAAALSLGIGVMAAHLLG